MSNRSPSARDALDQLIDTENHTARELPADKQTELLITLGKSGQPQDIPYLLGFLAWKDEPRPATSGSLIGAMRRWTQPVLGRKETPVVLEEEIRAVRLAAASAATKLLARARVTDIPCLDDAVRHAWRQPGVGNWHALDRLDLLELPEERPELIWGLASFHQNGYLREEAVRFLMEETSGCELPFLLVRLNDWVYPIRSLAYRAIEHRLRPEYACHWVGCLPLVSRLDTYTRHDHSGLTRKVYNFLETPENINALQHGWQHAFHLVRREAYRLCARQPQNDWSNLLWSALRDRDVVIRLWAAELAPSYLRAKELDEALTLLRQDRHPHVRGYALGLCLSARPDKLQAILRDALLDVSPAVRFRARFELKRLAPEEDFAAFYRDATNRLDGRRLAAAVAGLGETGCADDAPLLAAYLAHDSSRVAQAGVAAAFRLDPTNTREVLFEALADARPGVSKVARDLIRRSLHRDDATFLESLIAQATTPHARRNAASLLVQLPAWTGLRLLLSAASIKDPALQGMLRDQLHKWLFKRYDGRHALAPPTEREKEAILAALESAAITLPARFDIVFEKMRTTLR